MGPLHIPAQVHGENTLVSISKKSVINQKFSSTYFFPNLLAHSILFPALSDKCCQPKKIFPPPMTSRERNETCSCTMYCRSLGTCVFTCTSRTFALVHVECSIPQPIVHTHDQPNHTYNYKLVAPIPLLSSLFPLCQKLAVAKPVCLRYFVTHASALPEQPLPAADV